MSLPRSSPQAQAINPDAIEATLQSFMKHDMDLHSFMLVKNGHVVTEVYWEPYLPNVPHLLNSLSKSFTSTAIGIAVHENKLSLDDAVISFFPQYISPQIRNNMGSMKVKHLLSMTTGHEMDTTGALTQSENWVQTFLNIPITKEPGTHFLYNTGATYMLSAILHAATGEHLLDYLKPRLFDPLGFSEVTTETCPKGIHAGGFGMSVTTEDIAKFGQLYVQNGRWNGKELIPSWYVEEASSAQIANAHPTDPDWAQGYGYQFWRCRHNIFRADGLFGQFCIIIPDHNAVVVTTAGVIEMQDMLDIIWDKLLPGLSVDSSKLDAGTSSATSESNDTSAAHSSNASADSSDFGASAASDASAVSREAGSLQHTIDSCRYPAAYQRNVSSKKIAELNQYTYSFPPNPANVEAMSFHFKDEETSLSLIINQVKQNITLKHGVWTYCKLTFDGVTLPVAMSCTWRSYSKLEIHIKMLNKPYADKWICHFAGAALVVSTERNVWVMPGSALSKPYLPMIMGTALKV